METQYRGLESATAADLARRHQRICDAWHVGLPIGVLGRHEEREVYRKHEEAFFERCLDLGVAARLVAEAMILRGCSKSEINAAFLALDKGAKRTGWVGYAAFEEALATGGTTAADIIARPRTAART